MAKEKLFKATLKRGASYTLPGVGVFQRGESKVVTEEQYQKLQGTAAFDFKEVNAKEAEEAEVETSAANDSAPEAETAKPAKKKKK